MKGIEIKQVLQEIFRAIDGPTGTESDITRNACELFPYLTTRIENAQSRLGLVKEEIRRVYVNFSFEDL